MTFLALIILGAILYRLGGQEGKSTYYRDLGVSACLCAALGLLGPQNGLLGWLSLIPCFLLQWGALTTYRYFLPKPKDYTWKHYALHGFMVALASFPFAWATGLWVAFGVRCVVSAALVGFVSHVLSIDTWEERARGAILVGTVWIYRLIG